MTSRQEIKISDGDKVAEELIEMIILPQIQEHTGITDWTHPRTHGNHRLDTLKSTWASQTGHIQEHMDITNWTHPGAHGHHRLDVIG